MIKYCVIRQPAGIGDIFFLQKVAKIYMQQGFHVIWPVVNNFYSIREYIKHPQLTFVLESDGFPLKHLYSQNGTNPIELGEDIYLPIQNFDRHYPSESVMYSKYKKLDIDFTDWVDYFEFERNYDKEKELIDKLGVQNSKFNLVNRQYGSYPGTKNCTHMGSFENSIEMSYIDGFTIFDWIGVLLLANHIFTVETSLLYILKKLNLKNVTVFSKHDPPNYYHVYELFDKNWEYK